MTYGRKLLIAALFVSSSCGGSGGGTAGQTDSASDSNGSSSSASSTSGGPGATLPTTSGDDGTVSDSMTSNPSSDTATGTATTTDPTATTGPGDPTSASTTADDSATGTSTGAPDDTSTGGVIDTNSSTGDSSSTGPDCVPMPEVCNDLDDDCDDIVDDVDEGGDGICDCLNIALFGNKGSNPAAQFEAWLEAQGTQVDRIQTDNTPITQAILDKYDIIILDRLIRTYDPMEAALVAGWVGDGGGLMSMTGYTGAPPDVNNPNSIIGPMGLTYNNSKGIISGPVTQWNPHPVSENINSVTFLGGFYLNIMDDGIGMNTVVATLPAGPVAVAQVRNDGKLFIWGDEWIEFDSEWQNIPQIKQLWVNILAYLSPANFCSVPQ